jgi:hypothetical protein
MISLFSVEFLIQIITRSGIGSGTTGWHEVLQANVIRNPIEGLDL